MTVWVLSLRLLQTTTTSRRAPAGSVDFPAGEWEGRNLFSIVRILVLLGLVGGRRLFFLLLGHDGRGEGQPTPK